MPRSRAYLLTVLVTAKPDDDAVVVKKSRRLELLLHACVSILQVEKIHAIQTRRRVTRRRLLRVHIVAVDALRVIVDGEQVSVHDTQFVPVGLTFVFDV